MFKGPGIHDISAAEYHADPCPAPSLSHSIARVLIERSPFHACLAHPRLSPQVEAGEPSTIADIGSAVHKLTLQRGADIVLIAADDYRKAEAKAQRVLAYSQGKIPLLEKNREHCEAMASAARNAICDFAGCGMIDLLVEHAMIWTGANGQWRRGMVDAMTPDTSLMIDLKTTDSAEPGAFSRRFFSNGYDTQEAFYRMGAEALRPDTDALKRRFVFVVQERDPPYAVTIHEADQATRECAQLEIERAIATWDQCISTGMWPPYPRGPHIIHPPGWRLAQDADARIAAEMLGEYSEQTA